MVANSKSIIPVLTNFSKANLPAYASLEDFPFTSPLISGWNVANIAPNLS